MGAVKEKFMEDAGQDALANIGCDPGYPIARLGWDLDDLERLPSSEIQRHESEIRQIQQRLSNLLTRKEAA